MNKFEKRNAAYAEMSKIAGTSTKLHYINDTLYLGDFPVKDDAFIDSQEQMWRLVELAALCEQERSE